MFGIFVPLIFPFLSQVVFGVAFVYVCVVCFISWLIGHMYCFQAQHVSSLPGQEARRTHKDKRQQQTQTRLQRLGSPAYVGTWHDESINGFLRGIAAAAHRCVWHARVLTDFRAAYAAAEAAKEVAQARRVRPRRCLEVTS